jgi:hypothetical protein
MVLAYKDTSNVDPGSNVYCGTTSHIFAVLGRVNVATGTTAICAASDCALVPVMLATTAGAVVLPSKKALFNVPVQSMPLAVLTDPQLMVCDVTPDRDTVSVTLLGPKLPNVVPCVHTLALTYGLSWNTVGVLSTMDTCVRAALGVLRLVSPTAYMPSTENSYENALRWLMLRTLTDVLYSLSKSSNEDACVANMLEPAVRANCGSPSPLTFHANRGAGVVVGDGAGVVVVLMVEVLVVLEVLVLVLVLVLELVLMLVLVPGLVLAVELVLVLMVAVVVVVLQDKHRQSRSS